MRAWIVGLAVIAVLVALIGSFVPDEQVRRPMWLFIFAMLAAVAAYVWTRPDSPRTSSGWLGYIGAAFVGGAFLTGLDVIFFVRMRPGVSFFDAVLNSGWVIFDFVAIVAGVIVAAGGWAYSVVREREHDA